MSRSTRTRGVPGSSCASSCAGTRPWAPAAGGGMSRSVAGQSLSRLDGEKKRKKKKTQTEEGEANQYIRQLIWIPWFNKRMLETRNI